MTSIYDLSFNTPAGEEISMKDFEGKPVLVVNTATKCGLRGQFSELEELYQKHKDDGLVVLGFPCSQFAGQEPESNENMVETCQINFGVTFQLSEKIDVNGSDTHPIFNYLKSNTSSLFGSRIKWNFTKFLISPEGKVLKRYSPTTKPDSIEKDVEELHFD